MHKRIFDDMLRTPNIYIYIYVLRPTLPFSGLGAFWGFLPNLDRLHVHANDELVLPLAVELPRKWD